MSLDSKTEAMIHTEPRSPSNSALVALKAATQHEHDALDAALDLMNPGLDAVTYRRHIASFYGFYVPFECTLAMLSWTEHGIDLNARCKTALLRADLISLGVDDPDSLRQCQSLPSVPNATTAFGSLYVLEGATLGGQIISRHVEKQFGYTAAHGASYFNGYGARTGEMWMTFRRAVDACGTEADPRDEMIAGALATFVAFREWCTRPSAA